jgi:hypothetical protein
MYVPSVSDVGRAPWVASRQRIDSVDAMHRDPRFATPSGWPNFRDVYKNLKFLKTAEILLLGGDMGAYLIARLDIDEGYKADFIELLRITETYII